MKPHPNSPNPVNVSLVMRHVLAQQKEPAMLSPSFIEKLVKRHVRELGQDPSIVKYSTISNHLSELRRRFEGTGFTQEAIAKMIENDPPLEKAALANTPWRHSVTQCTVATPCTVASLTRQALLDADDPDSLKGPELCAAVGRLAEKNGVDPSNIMSGTVSKARSIVSEKCGGKITKEKLAAVFGGETQASKPTPAAGCKPEYDSNFSLTSLVLTVLYESDDPNSFKMQELIACCKARAASLGYDPGHLTYNGIGGALCHLRKQIGFPIDRSKLNAVAVQRGLLRKNHGSRPLPQTEGAISTFIERINEAIDFIKKMGGFENTRSLLSSLEKIANA